MMSSGSLNPGTKSSDNGFARNIVAYDAYTSCGQHDSKAFGTHVLHQSLFSTSCMLSSHGCARILVPEETLHMSLDPGSLDQVRNPSQGSLQLHDLRLPTPLRLHSRQERVHRICSHKLVT